MQTKQKQIEKVETNTGNKKADAQPCAFGKGAPKGFFQDALSYHVRKGNLEKVAGGWRATGTGKTHLASRVKPELLAMAKKAIASTAVEFIYEGEKYPLVELAFRTGMSRYLAPRYWLAGSKVSKAFFSAIFLA